MYWSRRLTTPADSKLHLYKETIYVRLLMKKQVLLKKNMFHLDYIKYTNNRNAMNNDRDKA